MNQQKVQGSLKAIEDAAKGLAKASDGPSCEVFKLAAEIRLLCNKVRTAAGLAQNLEALEITFKHKPGARVVEVDSRSYEEKLTQKLEALQVERERREQLGREALEQLKKGQAES